MGGRREVSVISHRPVTSSDLKHERLFFRGSVSTVLQLVVASSDNFLTFGYYKFLQTAKKRRDPIINHSLLRTNGLPLCVMGKAKLQ